MHSTPLKPILGLVIAMVPEAAALCGCRGWQPVDHLFRKRIPLDDGGEIIAVRAGTGWNNALAAARRLVRWGAGTLVSMGVSGGLSPGLRSGDLIVSRQCFVLADHMLQGPWYSPPAAVARACGLLRSAGRTVRPGSLLSMPDAILSVDRKTRLWQRFGALAVDMESAAVACAAMEAGISWLACRSICDPADRNVPAVLARALVPDGRLRLTAIGAALWLRPRLALDLTALGLQMGRAILSLQAAWRILQRSLVWHAREDDPGWQGCVPRQQ